MVLLSHSTANPDTIPQTVNANFEVYSTHVPKIDIADSTLRGVNEESTSGFPRTFINGTDTNPGANSAFSATQIYQWDFTDDSTQTQVNIGSGSSGDTDQSISKTFGFSQGSSAGVQGSTTTYPVKLVINNGHTTGVFTSAITNIIVEPDVRANLAGAAVTTNTGSGDNTLSLYDVTDLDGTNRAIGRFTNTSQNADNYEYDFQNDSSDVLSIGEDGSTAGTIFSGIARGKSFVDKIAMRALYSDELDEIEKQYAKNATAEAKAIDDFISNSPLGTLQNIGAEIMFPTQVKVKEAFESLTGKDVDKLALDIADKADDYVEKLDSEVFQYEMGVTEMFSDAIEQGDFSGYIRALTRTTKEAAASAPYMAVAAVPGGLGIIGVSTAAGGEFKENSEASKAYDELINLKITDPNHDAKKKELEEKIRNGGINLQNLAHHSVVGLSNSVFERFSGGLAKNFFNTFKGRPKDIVQKNLKDYALGFTKDSGGEGLTEAAQTAIEKASNFLIQGKEVEFEEAMQEI